MEDIPTFEEQIVRAAQLIDSADAILIGAGAGMGVDSGLPDYRGDTGLWQAYPALRHTRQGFKDIARQKSFENFPTLAWGFYGHRMQLYRDTAPHAGFGLLQKWSAHKVHGSFVYTSNVDGQFQKAGFSESRIVECHGSIHRLQCLKACTERTWNAADLNVVVDHQTCRLTSELPLCPYCDALARPNVLMFEDWTYLSQATDMQLWRLAQWEKTIERLVVIEIGAGSAIPSVRRKGASYRCPIIRINPRDAHVSGSESVSLPLAALTALQRIDAALGYSPANKDDSSK